MHLTYATPDDLSTWTSSPAPDNAERLLRSASMLVRRATRTAIYTTTNDGLPSHDHVVEAFRDATCAQAAAWANAGVDPARPLESGDRVAQSKSIGSASVTYGDTDAIVAARTASVSQLDEDAVQILTDAGLVGGRVWVTG